MSDPLPGPWVDPEIFEAKPWTSHKGIVKFFEFPVRIPAMSRRAFHLYWQRHHSPNVMNVTGFSQFMRKYNSGHILPEPMAGMPQRYGQDHPFEGAAEVWVNSWEEVDAWLSHPLYGALVQPDEPRFIAQDGRNLVLVTKEERLYEPDLDMAENGKTKLYLILLRKEGLSADTFHEALSAHVKEILAQAPLKALLRKAVVGHRLHEPNPLGHLCSGQADAVVELWFDTKADLEAFLANPAYAKNALEREAEFAKIDDIRAVVAKMRVVHDEFSFQPSTTQPIPFNWTE
jgi:hypothetical protein